VNTLVAKGQREQALRERGLLPPLEPRDLSTQEGEQDRMIDSQSLEPPKEARNQDAGPSAADLIKREWLGKNATPVPSTPSTTPPTLAVSAKQTAEAPSSATDTTAQSSVDTATSLAVSTGAAVIPLPPSVEVTPCPEEAALLPPTSFALGHTSLECDPAASITTPSLSADSHSVSATSSHLPDHDRHECGSESQSPAGAQQPVVEEGFKSRAIVTNEPDVYQSGLKESTSLPATVSSTRHHLDVDQGTERKDGKLSVTSSLSNLKRSLTRSRTKTAREPRIPGSTLNPEGLSRSKSLSSFARKQQLPPPDAPKRMARAPVVHSLSTIAQEAEGIEDEESRRLSEMCFLD
jgi:hypothetical protein